MFAGTMGVISTVLTAALLFTALPLFKNEKFLRKNYAGSVIPTALGVLFIPSFTVSYALSATIKPPGAAAVSGSAMILLIAGMGFLGFMDDMLGSREESGFKGHFRALFKGKITTGLFKAAGGLLISIGVSYMIGGPLWEIAFNALLIALCANLYNLLDMRPGRAVKCFLPVLTLLIIVNWNSNYVFASYLLSTGCISIVLFYGDLREKFMLGDAGSNILGAVIGLGVVITVSTWWRLAVLGLVLGMNLLSEAVSFSRIIDSFGPLRWIDRLGRKGVGGREVNY